MGCDAFLAEKSTDSFIVGSTTNKLMAVDSFETSLSIERLHDVTSKRQ
jgi:hypothetical protein